VTPVDELSMLTGVSGTEKDVNEGLTARKHDAAEPASTSFTSGIPGFRHQNVNYTRHREEVKR
jgi:hypothetical protein